MKTNLEINRDVSSRDESIMGDSEVPKLKIASDELSHQSKMEDDEVYFTGGGYSSREV